MAASSHHPASFLTLPPEIRLHIYLLLLAPKTSTPFSIRTEEPSAFEARRAKPNPLTRSSYRIMAGRFRARSVETTYILKNNPGIFPSILGVNKKLHSEAAHCLYSSNAFDFHTDVESVVPFLSDLTPTARRSIQRINIVKRALPYLKDFDKCEWREMCEFVARNIELKQLGLGILGGLPIDPMGHYQAEADIFEKEDFTSIVALDAMEWVRQLAAIKVLQRLDVKAIWEHCPPPCSSAIAFFVNFSASIEHGFAEYLRENMVLGSTSYKIQAL